MSRFVHISVSAGLIAFVILFGSAGDTPLSAQVGPVHEDVRPEPLPRRKLSGPRFGVTTFTGDVADLRELAGESIFMSQFGWQFETQIVSTDTGNRALLEWVVLFGGFESEMRNVSLSWLAGYRMPNGFELGFGPNFGLQLMENGGTTTSMVVAAGHTVPFGEIYVPLNVAVAFAQGGPRITTLLGWIIG